jgi:thioredoxin 1
MLSERAARVRSTDFDSLTGWSVSKPNESGALPPSEKHEAPDIGAASKTGGRRRFESAKNGHAHCSRSNIERSPGDEIMAGTTDVTDANFEDEVLKSDVPVVLDFWAEWCAPCRAISPILKQLAEDYDGKVKVVKMNIDENPETPGKYGVRAIPTVLAFNNGQVVEQLQGARPKAAFEEMVTKLV